MRPYMTYLPLFGGYTAEKKPNFRGLRIEISQNGNHCAYNQRYHNSFLVCNLDLEVYLEHGEYSILQSSWHMECCSSFFNLLSHSTG